MEIIKPHHGRASLTQVTSSALLAHILLLFALLSFVASLFRLSTTPPLWWDEGWTLTVARTWVEQGHYGILLNGRLAPAGLQAAFPVTAMVALSFRLFGVGVWQGRLVGVVFMMGALAVLYYLARRLYNRSVAVGTLAVLLLMSMHPELHPITMGRQALAELPMLFYLLAGYACFLSALDRPLRFMPLAVGLWAIALITKVQPLPFWGLSLSLPLLITLFKRRWKTAGLLGIALLGSFGVSRLLLSLQQLVLQGQTLPAAPVHGLFTVTAFVPIAANRVAALITTLEFGLPTLLGLCCATWRFIANRNKTVLSFDLEMVRLALLVLGGSWFAWYVLLSVGWVRYLFPVTFISAVFVAALLHDLSDGFSLSSTIRRGGGALRHRHFNRQDAGALLAITLTAMTVPLTLLMLFQSYTVGADISALQVADYLNTQTAPEALIETYDSELFFLLDRHYHYPPNQLHVELNRRTFLGEDVPIEYDPLAANPDYLVVGPFSRMWHLYDPVLVTEAFRLLHMYGPYGVYERVR